MDRSLAVLLLLSLAVLLATFMSAFSFFSSIRNLHRAEQTPVQTGSMLKVVTVGNSTREAEQTSVRVVKTIYVTHTVTRTETVTATLTSYVTENCECRNATLTSFVSVVRRVTVTVTVPASCLSVVTQTVTVTRTMTEGRTTTVYVREQRQTQSRSVLCVSGRILYPEEPVTCINGRLIVQTTETLTRTIDILGSRKLVTEVVVRPVTLPCPRVFSTPATVYGCVALR